MHPETRRQLLQLSAEFYAAHAEDFDASRGHEPWPGWARWIDHVAPRKKEAPLRVLDIGCGNARLARFLSNAGHRLAYRGVDGNAGLLAAAAHRIPPSLAPEVSLIEADFLAGPSPGADLPPGPFDLVALFGVLHHVPGHDWRRELLAAAARRLASGGVLALATWQFAGRPRFERRIVAWAEFERASGRHIDASTLETGDHLLRFGAEPDRPPRYCHQVSDAEFDSIAVNLEQDGISCSVLDDYRADGGEGDLNHYLILRRR